MKGETARAVGPEAATTDTGITASNRREAFKRFAGMATGAALGGVIVKFDPVAELGGQWREAYADADRLVMIEDALMHSGSDAERKAASDAVSDAWDRVHEIEQEIMAQVATTPAGVAAQVTLFRDYLSRSEYEPLVATVLSGLAGLRA